MARGEDDRGGGASRQEPDGGSEGKGLRDWYRRRNATRRHYAEMPPHRIRPETDGRYAQTRKIHEV